jgi:arsenite methyltransferase
MGLRDWAMAGIARQLRQPAGLPGRLIVRGLNRGNRDVVLAAVAATGLEAGQVGADIGFGGGVGLGPLLDRAGPGGHVHGIELSDTALSMARRHFSRHIADARLSLHAGDLADLPLPDDSVDAAITVNTVYFVQDLGPAFAELLRVVRPGGRVVIGVGDPAAMGAMPFTVHGFTLRPVEDLIALLRHVGFQDVRDERLGTDDRAFHLLVADRPLGGSPTQ